MKILVTGGAGFIGSHLVDRLISNRCGEVVVLDNFSRGRLEHLDHSAAQIRIVHGDIRDRALLDKLMPEVDLVFHLAAQSSVLGAEHDPDLTFQTNVVGTYEVLRAAASNGVKRVIFSSSREVYGDPKSLPVPEDAPFSPKNAYGVSKVAGEMYCRHFAHDGTEVVVLRFSNVYGTRDRDRVIPLFIERALAGENLTVFGSAKILDFLWIEDLLDVLVLASTRNCPEAPVNIGSGSGVNLLELAERVCALTKSGSSVRIAGERDPEVGAFIADVSSARKLFDLRCPQDPIEHVGELIEHLRREGRIKALGNRV